MYIRYSTTTFKFYPLPLRFTFIYIALTDLIFILNLGSFSFTFLLKVFLLTLRNFEKNCLLKSSKD